MKKSALFGAAAALLLSGQASASYISAVTGADMVGMEVTVTYTDTTTETLVWDMISMDPNQPYNEGYSGGVSGATWSLTQQGDSISETPPGANLPLGAWTFTYDGNGVGIESVYIDAYAGDVVFDTVEGDASANGSGPGRMFLTDGYSLTSLFSMNIEDELFGALTLSGVNGGALIDTAGSFQFLIDTDKVAVPTPATLGIFTAALGLMGFSRRKKA